MSAAVFAICTIRNCLVEANTIKCPACGQLVNEWLEATS